MNQLISAAVGEKLAAMMTRDYLEERAKRGSRKRYDAVSKRVPGREPEEADRLPSKPKRKTRSRSRS